MAKVGMHPVDVSAHGPGDSMADDKRAQSADGVGHDDEMEEAPVSPGAGGGEDETLEDQEDDDESLTDRVRVRSRKVRAPVLLDESDESEDEEDYSPEADAASKEVPDADAKAKASQQEGLIEDDHYEDEAELEEAYRAEKRKRMKKVKRSVDVKAPKTPPAIAEHEEGAEKVKARRKEEGDALGCFDITVWFERDRQRVFGQPKRHACVRSVSVSELLERQQQLRCGAGGKVTNANAAAVAERKALGPPSVLDGRPGDEFMLAVDLGAKVVPVADLWGFRSWPASCQNKDGKVVATSTHCCKIKGHPGLVAFVGPTPQSESQGATGGAAEAAKGEVPRFAKFVTEVLSGSGPGVQPKCQDCGAKAERQKEADDARKRKADEALEKENKRLKSSESFLSMQRDVEKEEKERIMREMKNLQKELKAAKEEMAKKKKEAEKAAKDSAEKAKLEARLQEAERRAEQAEKLRRGAEQKGKEAAAAKFEAERKRMEAKHKEELRKAFSASASMAEKEGAWEAERTKLLGMLQQAQADASKKAEDMMAGEREAFRQEKSQLEELLREERRKARSNGGSGDCKNCPMCLKRAQGDEPSPGKHAGLEELRERARQAGELENLLRAELKRAHDEWRRRDAEMRRRAAEEEKRKKAEERVRSQQEQRRKRDEEQRKFQEQMRRTAEERRQAEEQEARRKADEQRRQEEEARRIREAQERARQAEADAKKQSSEAELERQYLMSCAGTDRTTNYTKYENEINQLKNSTGALTKLSFFNIPWPPPNNPLFLLPDDLLVTKKKKLKTALLFWHTDKFNAICSARLLPEHREAIEAKVKRTVQAVIEAKTTLG